MPHYDLTVINARERWAQIRWALFVFPDIIDVVPAEDPAVVRIFYEGTRPYPRVWRVELLQAGFNVPQLEEPEAASTVRGWTSRAAARRLWPGAPAASASGRGPGRSSAARSVARSRPRGGLARDVS